MTKFTIYGANAEFFELEHEYQPKKYRNVSFMYIADPYDTLKILVDGVLVAEVGNKGRKYYSPNSFTNTKE